MLRKAFFGLTTACTIALGGCSTTQVTDFLGQVQAATATACLFVPTIDTILAVAQSLGIPYTGIAGGAIGTISNAICKAAPPPASARFKALPRQGAPAATVGTVNGIVVNGWRV